MEICDNETCRAFLPREKMHKVVRNDGAKCYLCDRCFKMMKDYQAEQLRKQRRENAGLIIPKGTDIEAIRRNLKNN